MIPLIASLFPEDSFSQSQSQDDTPQNPHADAPKHSDAHKRIELMGLVDHIAKGLTKVSPEQREYISPSIIGD